MSKKAKGNSAASIKARLLNLSRERKEDFNYTLTRFAAERLLYRLAESEQSGKFILKGATLFATWYDNPHRPTRDLDMLGFGDSEIDELKHIFSEICALEYEDGLIFDPDSTKADEIREGANYDGVRVKIHGKLSNAKISVQIDIGFGDTVVPSPQDIVMPVLLDHPPPRLKAYPVYSVISEKFEAMVSIGELNSRMKDFYDVWYIAEHTELDYRLLKEAVLATFRRRQTSVNDAIALFSRDFIADVARNVQWKAFLKRNGLGALEFSGAVDVIRRLVLPFIDPEDPGDENRLWIPHQYWMLKDETEFFREDINTLNSGAWYQAIHRPTGTRSRFSLDPHKAVESLISQRSLYDSAAPN